MPNQAARKLHDVFKNLLPDPLMTQADLDAFYSADLNAVRGGDKVASMELGLTVAHGGAFYKAFLMGHTGVGKSTEMTRLVERVKDRYRALRFSAKSDVDPVNFRPFDILLIMMVRLAEETAKPVAQSGAGRPPSDRLLEDIWRWFAVETNTLTQLTHTGVEGSAGIGPSPESWWGKALGLFATIKGEIKYSADRKKEVVEYRLNRLAPLMDLLNRLLDECNELLRKATGCEWLFIGEEFDKPGIPRAQTESLFLNYANIFQELRAHLVFNIPIGIVYSEKHRQLPNLTASPEIIPDTPVFHPDHTPHKEGREALRHLLECRVSPDLFDRGQMMRLIVASGGNLRDLFSMTGAAARFAILRNTANGKISRADVERAIDDMRTLYEGALGVDPSDEAPLTYEQKAERLLQIYNQDPVARIRDPQLNSLLRSLAVQEFNGKRWFGVHPLVVDILHSQGKIPFNDKGGVPGGTE